MKEDPKSVLAFKPPLDQHSVRFHSLNELSDWVDQELKAWAWLGKAERSVPQISQIWRATQSSLTEIRNIIGQHPGTADESVNSDLLNRIQQQLNHLASNGVRLLSSDPRAQYAAELAASDEAAAGYAVVAFVAPNQIPANNLNAIRGLIHADVYTHAIARKGVAPHRKALEETEKQWARSRDGQNEEFERFRTEFDALQSRLGEDFDQWRKEFSALIDGAKDALANIENTYDDKLALQAPVTYWRKKSSSHFWAAWIWGLAFVAAAVLGAWLLWTELKEWLIPEFLVSSTSPAAGYWAIVIFVASATLVIWPLRILSRMLLSNIHIRTDAEERATMANTYLSLLRSKEGLAENERRLILENLFRPAATGIVRDDAMPPSVVSAITRAASGDRS